MANRVMQQKRQRMRRAYLKRPRHLGPPKNHPLLVMQRASAESLAKLDAVTRFPGMTEPRYQALASKAKLEHAERLRVYRKVGEFCPDLNFFVVVNTPIHRARCFFTSAKDCYIMVYEEFRKGTIRRSITYGSKENCVAAFQSNRMKWVEYSKFPPHLPELVPE